MMNNYSHAKLALAGVFCAGALAGPAMAQQTHVRDVAKGNKLDQDRIDAEVKAAILAGRNRIPGGDGMARNVIVLIPDGCSYSIETLARWYKGEPLAVDEMVVGSVSTWMANSVITDSAPAATSIATGFKSTNRFIGVGPRANDVLSTYQWPLPSSYLSYRPLATVLEGAKLLGKSTGIVCTCTFTHATPGSFAAHSDDRGKENRDISEHMVYNNIDLVFGGGERFLLPAAQGGRRVDGEDLIAVLTGRNYSIVRTEAEMNTLTRLPAYGMFAWSSMEPELNRPIYEPQQPSLAAMTQKAIHLLSQDHDGFFLMVEGSQVDWAGHANDAAWMVTDFLEFDEAVAAALDFAKMDGHTLVLAFPDHNTGGMDIGSRKYNGAYTELTVEALVDPLKDMTVTAGALAEEILAMPGGATVANIISKTQQLWNMTVTPDVAQKVLDLTGVQEGLGNYTISFDYALGRVLSEHYTAVGWNSHGHNGEDVPLWAFGPGAPSGLLDNTDLATTVADALGFPLELVNRWLFVDLGTEFPNWVLDTTDPANPVARVNGTFASAELPARKDFLRINTFVNCSRTYELPGVVVHAPQTGKVYVSLWAVWLMRLYGL
jgi:alkaline phosphatase